MKTTGVSSIPKFGLLDFLGHPIGHPCLPQLGLASSCRHLHRYASRSSGGDPSSTQLDHQEEEVGVRVDEEPGVDLQALLEAQQAGQGEEGSDEGVVKHEGS